MLVKDNSITDSTPLTKVKVVPISTSRTKELRDVGALRAVSSCHRKRERLAVFFAKSIALNERDARKAAATAKVSTCRTATFTFLLEKHQQELANELNALKQKKLSQSHGPRENLVALITKKNIMQSTSASCNRAWLQIKRIKATLDEVQQLKTLQRVTQSDKKREKLVACVAKRAFLSEREEKASKRVSFILPPQEIIRYESTQCRIQQELNDIQKICAVNKANDFKSKLLNDHLTFLMGGSKAKTTHPRVIHNIPRSKSDTALGSRAQLLKEIVAHKRKIY
eukprot:m.11565 g.11565  ORF g.11565 m.11565 type:complete len:283 (-) comp4476_c0_seq1:77-925(-)